MILAIHMRAFRLRCPYFWEVRDTQRSPTFLVSPNMPFSRCPSTTPRNANTRVKVDLRARSCVASNYGWNVARFRLIFEITSPCLCFSRFIANWQGPALLIGLSSRISKICLNDNTVTISDTAIRWRKHISFTLFKGVGTLESLEQLRQAEAESVRNRLKNP
jgi:hypothetical protein